MAVAIQPELLSGAAVVAVFLGLALPAAAQTSIPQVIEGFEGIYAPSQWILINQNADGLAYLRESSGQLNRYITPSNRSIAGPVLINSNPILGIPELAADSLFLLGGDQVGHSSCRNLPSPDICLTGATLFLKQVSVDTVISFHWFYQTLDISPRFDDFSYRLIDFNADGTVKGTSFLQLSNDVGALTQTGFAEVSVKAGQGFAFEIFTDNRFGAASVIIDQFRASFELPGCEPLSDPDCKEPDEEDPDEEDPDETTVPEPGSAIALTLFGISFWKLRRPSK